MSFVNVILDFTLGPAWVPIARKSIPVGTVISLLAGTLSSRRAGSATERGAPDWLRLTVVLSVLHILAGLAALVTLLAPGIEFSGQTYVALGLFGVTLGLRLLEVGTVPKDLDTEVVTLYDQTRNRNGPVVGPELRFEDLEQNKIAESVIRTINRSNDGSWEYRIQHAKLRVRDNLETFARDIGLEIEGDPPR